MESELERDEEISQLRYERAQAGKRAMAAEQELEALREELATAENVAHNTNKLLAESRAENKALREALKTISTALDAYGVDYCRTTAKNALKQGEE